MDLRVVRISLSTDCSYNLYCVTPDVPLFVWKLSWPDWIRYFTAAVQEPLGSQPSEPNIINSTEFPVLQVHNHYLQVSVPVYHTKSKPTQLHIQTFFYKKTPKNRDLFNRRSLSELMVARKDFSDCTQQQATILESVAFLGASRTCDLLYWTIVWSISCIAIEIANVNVSN